MGERAAHLVELEVQPDILGVGVIALLGTVGLDPNEGVEGSGSGGAELPALGLVALADELDDCPLFRRIDRAGVLVVRLDIHHALIIHEGQHRQGTCPEQGKGADREGRDEAGPARSAGLL